MKLIELKRIIIKKEKIMSVINEDEVLGIYRSIGALLDGHFILSSGLHSSKYIQCAKLLSYPHLAKNICLSLSKKIKKN